MLNAFRYSIFAQTRFIPPRPRELLFGKDTETLILSHILSNTNGGTARLEFILHDNTFCGSPYHFKRRANLCHAWIMLLDMADIPAYNFD
jgi:hypothetical protein